MPVEASGQVFRFGGFALDLDRGTLRGGDGTVFLRPKAYGLLTHLCRNMGRVVPKSELLDAVWPGVFVTEDSLTQSIREIRRAIGEEMVRTVSRRGYMLAAESEAVPDFGAQPIVAVLRFDNAGGERADEAIVDGFAEDIINGLARFGAMTVLARNSSFSFASHERSQWPQIRARIGADFLVEGSLRRQGDGFLAVVNLIDAASARQIWGERYQASDDGVFAIQREIVAEIVGRLISRVSNAGLEQASRRHVTSLAAWELVLRGVALLRDPAQTDLDGATKLFELALDRDPAYGLAHTYLALTRALVGEFGSIDAETLTEARDLADRGASLSPDQAPCRRIQSLVRLYLRQHEAAEHYLRMALELNPYDAECVEQMGFLLTMRGRPIDALGWFARAARIDPMQPHWYQYDRSMALYLTGEYRPAAAALELSTRPRPWIRTRLAACYAQLGEIDAARRQAELVATEGGDFSPFDYARRGVPFEKAADAEHFAEGVLRAFGRET